MAHLPKGGVAKLQAYVGCAQRASAGEAPGAMSSGKASQGLCAPIRLLSCRSF